MSSRPAWAEKACPEQQHAKHGLVYTCNPNIVRAGARRAGTFWLQHSSRFSGTRGNAGRAGRQACPCTGACTTARRHTTPLVIWTTHCSFLFLPPTPAVSQVQGFELSSFLFLGAKQTPNELFKNIVVLKQVKSIYTFKK